MVLATDQLANFLQQNSIIFAILVIGGTVLGIKVLGFMLKKIIDIVNQHESFLHVDGRLIRSIRVPLYIGIVLAGVRIGLIKIPFLNPYSTILNHIFYAGWLILLAVIIFKVIDIAGFITGRVWFGRSKANASSLMMPLSRIGKGLTIFFIGISAVAVFGVNVTNVLFSWGLLGFAIVVALQPIILDIFAGLSIASQGSIKVGQRVILNSGEVVEVKEIQLQNTIFRDLLSGSMYSVSNSELMKQKMTILEDGILPVSISFKVNYGSIERARDMALKIGNELQGLARKPIVNVRELEDDNKVRMELFLWIYDASKRDYVITQASSKIADALKRNAVLTE